MKRGVEALRHELDVLSRLARALATTTRLDELLDQIVRAVGEVLEFDDCVLYLWDEEAQRLVQRAAWGPKRDPERPGVVAPLRLRLGEGIVGSVAATRLVEIVHDVSIDRRYLPDLAPGGSELAVPILHHDRLIGVLDAESARRGAFSADDAIVLTRFSDLGASAIVGVQRLERDTRSVEEALRATEERLRHLSTHDALTGLLDRVRFQEEVVAAVQTATATALPLALALVSLADFGAVNSAIGTAAGDELLHRVAGVLREQARRGDAVARIAGTEFGVLMRSTTAPQAVAMAQTMVAEICRLELPDGAPALAASAGVAALEPGEVVGAQALLARALRARRAAEDSGAGVATD
jgi:diguanylate cyclase (GGDEF)-like protein